MPKFQAWNRHSGTPYTPLDCCKFTWPLRNGGPSSHVTSTCLVPKPSRVEVLFYLFMRSSSCLHQVFIRSSPCLHHVALTGCKHGPFVITTRHATYATCTPQTAFGLIRLILVCICFIISACPSHQACTRLGGWRSGIRASEYLLSMRSMRSMRSKRSMRSMRSKRSMRSMRMLLVAHKKVSKPTTPQGRMDPEFPLGIEQLFLQH